MDEIEIDPYNPVWPAMFQAEAERLRTILPADLVLDIQHYGSTAVPGLDAKPIIDMLLATSDLAAARQAPSFGCFGHGNLPRLISVGVYCRGGHQLADTVGLMQSMGSAHG